MNRAPKVCWAIRESPLRLIDLVGGDEPRPYNINYYFFSTPNFFNRSSMNWRAMPMALAAWVKFLLCFL
jgi:hypothetical protein